MYALRIIGRTTPLLRTPRYPLRPLVASVRCQSTQAPHKPSKTPEAAATAKATSEPSKDDKPAVAATSKEVSHPEETSVAKTEDKAPKKPLWDRIKVEAQHYWDGTKLLGYEIRVSTKLLMKYVAGYALTRRESNQLQRTLVDVSKLLPFAMFVLIPFAELLLPVALKVFPNLLPSTYESKSDRLKKRNKLSKTRASASEYIKNTLEEGGLTLSKKITDKEKEAFVSFFDEISAGKNPSRDHLVQVARLFKNDQVLDNLSRNQLVAMCKYMQIRPFGSDAILRYQIRHRLLNIIKDDKAIDYEGVESLSIPELQIACSQRGIKTVDVSPARLREDLETWLNLRLRQKIPSTLLILSNSYAYGDKSHSIDTYYDALLAVLSSIPDEVYNVAKAQLSDDSKLKLNILKEQDELINEENEREKGTINAVKDDIKLDEYEETATDGLNVVPDEDPDVVTSKAVEAPVQK